MQGRLLSQLLAERAAFSLLASRATPTLDLLKWVIEQRDDLAKRATRTFALLFTTLALLTLVMFGQTTDFALLGIKIDDRNFFVFAALVVGNLLYVVSTGLFAKTIAIEFLLLRLSESDYFSLGKSCTGFMVCHPLNMFAYARLEGLDELLGPVKRRVVNLVNFYTKYLMIVAYGIFFYTVLIIFLLRTWKAEDIGSLAYFWILIGLNIMTVVTSYSVFLYLSKTEAQLVANDNSTIAKGSSCLQAPSEGTLPPETDR